jgi:hypothetical protein
MATSHQRPPATPSIGIATRPCDSTPRLLKRDGGESDLVHDRLSAKKAAQNVANCRRAEHVELVRGVLHHDDLRGGQCGGDFASVRHRRARIEIAHENQRRNPAVDWLPKIVA